MRDLAGKVAVVTGAGSGIGRALALELGRRGSLLALNDVDGAGLAGTAQAIASGPGGSAPLTARFSVADRDAFAGFADRVADSYGRVDLVVNNAGIGHDTARIDELPLAAFRTVMEVNFWGVVHGTQIFLPHLLDRPEAAIVNLSSSFGLTAVALQSPYCASKFAVRGFTDSLRMELRAFAPHVTATCVHPGGIRTRIGRNSLAVGARSAQERAREIALAEAGMRTTPERAAATIVEAVRRKRERVVIGADARLGDLLARLLPVASAGLVLRQAARTGFLQPAPRSRSRQRQAARRLPRRS